MGVAISLHSVVILKFLKKTYKIVLEFLRLKNKNLFYFFEVRVSILHISTPFSKSRNFKLLNYL